MNNIQANSQEITPFPLAIVTSQFNQKITSLLLDGALSRLAELNFSDDLITTVIVPGAVEIPLCAQSLAKTKRYKSIVTLGAVIRGETSHYDYVCKMVADGCLQVSLENEIPVVFGVLTTENQEQALDRVGGRHGHKGVDAVNTAIEMVDVLAKINHHNL